MSSDAPAAAQFNWIGDVRLTPVFPSASPDLLLAPKTELRTGITDDGVAVRLPRTPSR